MSLLETLNPEITPSNDQIIQYIQDWFLGREDETSGAIELYGSVNNIPIRNLDLEFIKKAVYGAANYSLVEYEKLIDDWIQSSPSKPLVSMLSNSTLVYAKNMLYIHDAHSSGSDEFDDADVQNPVDIQMDAIKHFEGKSHDE